MRRVDFIRELSYLLQDISDADREEALRYYNDYFEEAGPENEESVAEELGSPEKVAAIIKDGLLEDEKERGSFTDTGYTDERFEQNTYHYMSDPGRGEKKKKKSIWSILLIALVCLCALPILGPLAIAAAAVVLALFLAGIVVVLALGVSGIAIVISGILALGSGIAKLVLVPAAGLFICGAALLLIALGILVAWFMWWLLFKVLPPVINGLIRIFRRPFERKETAS